MNRRFVLIILVIVAAIAAIYVGATMRRSSEEQVGVGNMRPEDLRQGPVSTEGEARAPR